MNAPVPALDERNEFVVAKLRDGGTATVYAFADCQVHGNLRGTAAYWEDDGIFLLGMESDSDIINLPEIRATVEYAVAREAADEIESLRNWRDTAVANGARRECSTRDRRLQELQAEVARLTDVLRRHRFIECDIPACNCGSWHHRYGLPERFAEIKQVLEDAQVLDNSTGWVPRIATEKLVLQRDRLRDEVELLTAERDALLARVEAAERDAGRYRWLRNESLHRLIRGPICIDADTWGEPVMACGKHITLDGAELDAAIDAAMREGGK